MATIQCQAVTNEKPAFTREYKDLPSSEKNHRYSTNQEAGSSNLSGVTIEI